MKPKAGLTSVVLLMKLKGGSGTFHYDSSYWTDDKVLNSEETNWSEDDDTDAKLPAFNSVPFTVMAVCYKSLFNCYTFDLAIETESARALFSGGYRKSADMGGGSKEAWTDLFLPKDHENYQEFWEGGSGKGCGMMKPGINTELHEDGNITLWR